MPATAKPETTRADLGLLRVLRDDGAADPALDPRLSDEELLRLYRAMVLIRTLDDRCLKLQRQGRIAFYGTSTGQEAATVGSAFCLTEKDWCFPALREGGAALMRGMPVSRYIAQLMGNSHDEEKGHQQPMHFSFRAANHVSLSSPIGTQVPQGVGAARAIQIRGAKEVVLAYIGDGGTSEPDFHVALTFAGVWKCPAVIFCQNNGWAISVPTSAQTASPTIAVKARGYGMPGVRVDGNDVLAVVRATREAVDRARSGGGPTFIEAVTYRRHGHSSSDDPSRYRDERDVAAWEKRDPIERFRAHLVLRGLWSKEQEFAEIERQNALVTREIQEAEKAPPPALDTLIEDVTGTIRPELREQLAEVRPYFEEGKTAEGAFPL
ncbi:MAG: Pyruvate dehydrogenase E1 component subunit alpha [Planctomycetes bacterium]|nr:Pyruvate dehydrogenase E1 component subunit alpha [Planctomycetota bacterium]